MAQRNIIFFLLSSFHAKTAQKETFLSQAGWLSCLNGNEIISQNSHTLHDITSSSSFTQLKIMPPLQLFLCFGAFSLLHHQPFDTLLPAVHTKEFV
jgi:hypothetical protein